MTPALAVGVLVFLVTVPFGGPFVRWLRVHGVGKRIRVETPESHQVKMGTPTMGGLLFLTPVAVVLLILLLRGNGAMGLPLLALVAYAVLGAIDDAMGLTRDSKAPLAVQIGLLARYMFLLQLGIALVLVAWLYGGLRIQAVRIPGLDQPVALGLWYVPIAAFIIVSTVNGVNETDGVDGLAGGTSALAFGFYGVIAARQGQTELAILCLAVAGALLAFLWYNAHPAQMFMGGIGSLTLGGLLAVVALMTEQWLLLPIIGVIFAVEDVTVTLQVSYFKYTRKRYGEGRRIFKRTPIHHGLELSGWSETQITQRFWCIGAVAGMLGVALAFWQIGMR